MLQAIEAIIEQNGAVRLLEPLHLTRQTRAVLTLLEPVNIMQTKRPLREFIGALKHSSAFTGNPLAVQQAMRDEWD